jgi:hypothetical protein
MTNVFSLASMEDKYHVTYDSTQESAFIIHTPRGPVQFTRGPENLYYHKPKYQTTKSSTSMVKTIKENESLYTPRQVNHAWQACKLLHALGCPTVANLKAVIWMNSITNCPVTIDDVNLVEKIFGKDIMSLKGKRTQKKPTPVVSDIMEIPPELMEAQQDVDLCFDTMFINEMLFLTTVSKRIIY